MMINSGHHPSLKYVDHSYRDFSRYVDYGGQLIKHKKSTNNFPARLHRILSDGENSDAIAWMPHGRAWKILDKERLIKEVVPNYFVCKKYESFSRQLNGWGFKRLHQSGPDAGCYYHECFLRDLPKLTCLIRRLGPNLGKSTPFAQGEPNFYKMSKWYPLPPPGSPEPLYTNEGRKASRPGSCRARAVSLDEPSASSEAVALTLRRLTSAPARPFTQGNTRGAVMELPAPKTSGHYRLSSAHDYSQQQRPVATNDVSPTYYEEYTGYYDHYIPSQCQLHPHQAGYGSSNLCEQFQPSKDRCGNNHQESHIGNYDNGAFAKGFQDGQAALFSQLNPPANEHLIHRENADFARGYQDGLTALSPPQLNCVAHPESTDRYNEQTPKQVNANVENSVSDDPLEPIPFLEPRPTKTDGNDVPQTKMGQI